MLCILIEEVLRAGVDEICLVVRPGDERPYAEVAGDHAGRLHFVHQSVPLGHGHAVYCAADSESGATISSNYISGGSEGIWVNGVGEAVTICDNIISTNGAGSMGPGIHISYPSPDSDVVITSNIISGRNAQLGAGIHIEPRGRG